MTQSDPNTPSPDPRSSLGALIDAFTKLPPLLSYGGLILIAAIVILSISGVLPDALLWIPAVAIAAFLIYTFIDRYFTLQEKKLPGSLPPATNNPQPAPNLQSPISDPESPTPAEWERRYLRHLVHQCGFPPSMALVDIKEAGMGGQKLALERIFTSLDVPAADGRSDPSHTALHYDQLDPAQSEKLQREPALAALSRRENSRLVILGAP
ncbi:MAG: hypothetical protein KC441_19215, partial [Anaerolineales bacterium]|nr:hypothetical protein [Anaerolineales bacterium]